MTYVTFGAGSVLGGAIISGCISAGVDTFKQVVVDGKSFSEVNWKQVATEGVSSFVSSAVMGGLKTKGINLSTHSRAFGKSFIKQTTKGLIMDAFTDDTLTTKEYYQKVVIGTGINYFSEIFKK